MTHSPFRRPRSLIFRPFRAWYRVGYAALLAGSLAFGASALWFGRAWWPLGLIGIGACASTAAALAFRYRAQAVILHGFTLICRYGWLIVREHSFVLWQVDIETRWNLLGRLLDYGTVYVRADGETIVLYRIASIRRLRTTLAMRQSDMILPANRWMIANRSDQDDIM